MNKLALTVAVLLLAVSAWWFGRDEPNRPGRAELPEELADEPDLYMQAATITQFEPDGSLQYELVAAQIRHFEHDQSTRMSEPVMDVYNPDQPPWHVESREGFIEQRQTGETLTEVVLLREDVVLTQMYPDGRFVTVRSKALDVYPETKLADTDQGVIIDTNTGQSLADGLRANLELGSMALSRSSDSRVRTTIQPEQMK